MMKVRGLVSLLAPFLARDDEKREAARRADYRRLFASTLGRRVLADILNEGGLFRPHAGRYDDRSLALLEGRRWLALDIFDLAGGARDRLGLAMTRDDIGEALNEPDAHRLPADRDPAADPEFAGRGADGEPLFVAGDPAGPILADGDD